MEFSEHINEDLSAYIDGELSPERQAEVEEHLKTCDTCRAELAQMRLLAELTTDSLRAERCLSAADKAAFLHGTLAAERQEEVEAHLQKCRNCSEELQELRRWATSGSRGRSEETDKRGWFGRFTSVFVPLAAAAAILVGVSTSLLHDTQLIPQLRNLNVKMAAVRSPEEPDAVDVEFAGHHPFHINDTLQLRLDPSGYDYAAVFLVSADGSVVYYPVGYLKDFRFQAPDASNDVILPEVGDRWRLSSTIGTDLIFVVFTKDPIAARDAQQAEAVLKKLGPLPEMPYGFIYWLGKSGDWTDEAPRWLDAVASGLKKAFAGKDVAVRGIAFTHE